MSTLQSVSSHGALSPIQPPSLPLPTPKLKSGSSVSDVSLGKGPDLESEEEIYTDDDNPDLAIGGFRRRSVLADSIFSQSTGKSLVTNFAEGRAISSSPEVPTKQLRETIGVDLSPDSPLANTFSVRKTPTKPTNYDADDTSTGVELIKKDGVKEEAPAKR